MALHNFAVKAVKGTSVEYDFTDSGVRFVLREYYALASSDNKYVKTLVASVLVSDNNDKYGEGLVIQLGEYIRFIPRDKFAYLPFEYVCFDVSDYLKRRYPSAIGLLKFKWQHLCSFMFGSVLGWILYNFSRLLH